MRSRERRRPNRNPPRATDGEPTSLDRNRSHVLLSPSIRGATSESFRYARRSIFVFLLLSGPVMVHAGSALASPPSFPTEMRDTAAFPLRLSDLGPGYTIGDDSGCGIGTENAPENLRQAVITHLPENCS